MAIVSKDGLKITGAALDAVKIAKLSTNPNSAGAYGQGGLTPAQLKAKFDAGVILLAEKLNALIDKIPGGESGLSAMMDSGIPTGEAGVNYSVRDIMGAILSGVLAQKLVVDATANPNKTLADVYENMENAYDGMEELIAALAGRVSTAEGMLGSHTNTLSMLGIAISGKVDNVTGKGLSQNDYTDADKAKLAGLSAYDDTEVLADIAAAQGDILTAQETADEAKVIAQGRAKAKVFATAAAMEAYLSDADNADALSTGDNLFIEDTEVTDYWVKAVLTEADAVTGYYYEIAQLETEHPDLTDFYTKAEVDEAIENVEVDLTGYYTKAEVDNAIDGATPDLTAITARLDALEYVPIAIGVLTVKESGTNSTVCEVGHAVSGVVITWTVNKTPTTIALDGESIAGQASPITLTGLSITANRTFNLAVGDGTQTDTKAASITFQRGVYYGAAAAPGTVDSAFILTLSKSLQGARGKTFTATAAAGQYLWYACPASYGAASFKVGGFDGGFTKYATISHTNASGSTADYDVYRSGNAGLGATTVVVS